MPQHSHRGDRGGYDALHIMLFDVHLDNVLVRDDGVHKCQFGAIRQRQRHSHGAVVDTCGLEVKVGGIDTLLVYSGKLEGIAIGTVCKQRDRRRRSRRFGLVPGQGDRGYTSAAAAESNFQVFVAQGDGFGFGFGVHKLSHALVCAFVVERSHHASQHGGTGGGGDNAVHDGLGFAQHNASGNIARAVGSKVKSIGGQRIGTSGAIYKGAGAAHVLDHLAAKAVARERLGYGLRCRVSLLFGGCLPVLFLAATIAVHEAKEHSTHQQQACKGVFIHLWCL